MLARVAAGDRGEVIGGQGVQAGGGGVGDVGDQGVGGEAAGIPTEFADDAAARIFSVPGRGGVESLNLATAVNICVYELCR